MRVFTVGYYQEVGTSVDLLGVGLSRKWAQDFVTSHLAASGRDDPANYEVILWEGSPSSSGLDTGTRLWWEASDSSHSPSRPLTLVTTPPSSRRSGRS